eukprot:6209552-Pleurochrysis_carterae.AAC.1
MPGEHSPFAKRLEVPRRARIARGKVCGLRTSCEYQPLFPCLLEEMTPPVRAARLGNACKR